MRVPGLAAAIMFALVASACSNQVSEVRTNSGGTLDCRSEVVHYAMIEPVPDAAVQSPADALLLLGDDAPPGTPEIESESPERIIFLYRDADGHRRGRVFLEQRDGAGWLLRQTERCD